MMANEMVPFAFGHPSEKMKDMGGGAIVEFGKSTQTKSAWDLQSQMTRKVLKIVPFKSAVCLDCSALHIPKRRLQTPQQSLDRHRCDLNLKIIWASQLIFRFLII